MMKIGISRSLQHRKAHFIVEGYNLLKDTAEQAALHLKPISIAKFLLNLQSSVIITYEI